MAALGLVVVFIWRPSCRERHLDCRRGRQQAFDIDSLQRTPKYKLTHIPDLGRIVFVRKAPQIAKLADYLDSCGSILVKCQTFAMFLSLIPFAQVARAIGILQLPLATPVK